MKPLIAILAIYAITLTAAEPNPFRGPEDQQRPGGPQPGRYQLLSATVTIDQQPVPILFRIDTTTGETWRYQYSGFPVPPSMAAKPTSVTILVEGWSPIGSYPVAFSNYLAMHDAPPAKHKP